jgi:hypothetical protein
LLAVRVPPPVACADTGPSRRSVPSDQRTKVPTR